MILSIASAGIVSVIAVFTNPRATPLIVIPLRAVSRAGVDPPVCALPLA
jgi:hypothetical protein